jgi:primosomal protein N''
MKKTEYFTSANHTVQQLEAAIETVKVKRDTWLAKNESLIAKIDNEDIKFTTWNTNNQHVFVTIQLTYYPKK